MKKLILLILISFSSLTLAYAQKKTKPDTVSEAFFNRLKIHKLTKSDSVTLKSKSGKVLVLNKHGAVVGSLTISSTRSNALKPDSAYQHWQAIKTRKTDTVYTKIASTGLAEKNKILDSLDLSLQSCDFENAANAMVLYNIGQMYSDAEGIVVERHQRVKIFNENGKSIANIRLLYTNQYGTEQIVRIHGQTINLNQGVLAYTTLDTSQIYRQDLDKYHGMVSISMPNVKAGSVVELAYVLKRAKPKSLPDWSFQSDLPTRYSQFIIQLYRDVKFNTLYHTSFPIAKDSVIFGGMGHVWAMNNIPSLKNEPFMRSAADYLQSMQFVLSQAITPDGYVIDVAGSWETLAQKLAGDKEFNKMFDQNINDREGLVKHAKKLPTDDAKINYLFNQVKTLMKWNSEKNWVSKDGIKVAWEKKTGNWGEINMVLCHLLNDAGVAAYPMLTSTRDNGKIFQNFANIYQINKLVTYAQANNSRYYVLDASGKYNNYSETPFELLNSYGLCLNKDPGSQKLIFLENSTPVKQLVSVNADIKPDGTMSGSAQISSFGYNKTNALSAYNELQEKKYIEMLSDNDNNLKISSLKLENADVDSLPLVQTLNFKFDLPGQDEKYIYFSPNLFTGLRLNPFINERRFSDIDFGCNNLFSINGKYKIPDGYKIDALPKSQTITMPDKSITFKRVAVEEDGYIVVYYVINYKQSFFPKDVYYEAYNFFKKVYEMLNEQIVLKKQ